MNYRTRTYIAADFDNEDDVAAVEQLRKWNNSDYWSLSFTDAHDLQSSRDTSLYCSIKSSLSERMNRSKRFIIIIGENTDSITKGGCQYCSSYKSNNKSCAKGNSVDYRSYIKYECDLAVKANIEIVVLYNATSVNKQKCPSVLRDKGKHCAMVIRKDGKEYWNYQAVKKCFE